MPSGGQSYVYFNCAYPLLPKLFKKVTKSQSGCINKIFKDLFNLYAGSQSIRHFSFLLSYKNDNTPTSLACLRGRL